MHFYTIFNNKVRNESIEPYHIALGEILKAIRIIMEELIVNNPPHKNSFAATLTLIFIATTKELAQNGFILEEIEWVLNGEIRDIMVKYFGLSPA